MKSALIALAFFAVFVGAANAADHIYLKIPPVDGESMDPGHIGEINILSFAGKILQPSTTRYSASGHASAAGAQFTPLELVKKTDKASVKLMIDCALGTVFPKATLTVSAPTPAGLADFLTIELTNVIISSYSFGGDNSGDDIPTESITLNFSAIKWTYRLIGADGQIGPPIIGNFDLRLNRQVSVAQ